MGCYLKLLFMQISTDNNTHSKYCGIEIPTMLSFNATFVELKFVSDAFITKSGFKISYRILSRKGYYEHSIYYAKILFNM